MSMKIGFLTAVGISAVVLIVVAVVLIVLTRSGVLLTEVGISLGNLLLDVFVGIFTIWGLYWVVSELALKPDLRLIIGKELADQRDIEPLLDAADALIGRDVPEAYTRFAGDRDLILGRPASLVAVGLFLENTRPKAAQYVRVALRVRGVPRPEMFRPVKGSFEYKPRVNVMRGEAMFLQFGDDLVVYKGHDGVFLGKIWVAWPQGIHPEEITFVAHLYSLEGEPKEVTVSRPIHWI